MSELLSHNRVNIVDLTGKELVLCTHDQDPIKKLRNEVKSASEPIIRQLVTLRVLSESHTLSSLTREYSVPSFR